MILAGKLSRTPIDKAKKKHRHSEAGCCLSARAWPPTCAFFVCIAVRGCVVAALHECAFVLCHLFISEAQLLASCFAMSCLLVSPRCIYVELFARSFQLIDEALFLVRHSQPRRHHGRFHAFSSSCLDANLFRMPDA
jgi:hypothetical protein